MGSSHLGRLGANGFNGTRQVTSKWSVLKATDCVPWPQTWVAWGVLTARNHKQDIWKKGKEKQKTDVKKLQVLKKNVKPRNAKANAKTAERNADRCWGCDRGPAMLVMAPTRHSCLAGVFGFNAWLCLRFYIYIYILSFFFFFNRLYSGFIWFYSFCFSGDSYFGPYDLALFFCIFSRLSNS